MTIKKPRKAAATPATPAERKPKHPKGTPANVAEIAKGRTVTHAHGRYFIEGEPGAWTPDGIWFGS